MAVPTRTRLRVRREHRTELPWGRTFRDLEAQVIQYHEVPHLPYRSSISGGFFRFDLGKEGVPIFVELGLADGQTKIDGCLRPPVDFDLGSIRFLDCPSRIRPRQVTTDESKTLFHIRLSDKPASLVLQAARGALWEIDADSCLSGLWLLTCQDDPYGRGRLRWRARAWQLARRRALLDGDSVRPSPISVETESEA